MDMPNAIGMMQLLENCLTTLNLKSGLRWIEKSGPRGSPCREAMVGPISKGLKWLRIGLGLDLYYV